MNGKKSLTRTLTAVLAQSLVGVWVLVGAIALAPAASAQQHEYQKIPASPKPPPGLENLEEKQKEAPATPPRPASVDELLEQVKKQPGGKEKVEAARGKRAGEKIPGSARPTTPPGLEDVEKKQKEAPARPPRPASVDELLEQVRKQPGGKGKVDAAMKAKGKRGGGGGALAWLASLNPFHAETAYADSSFSQQLNAGNHWRTSSAWVLFFGPRYYPWSAGWPYVPMYRATYSTLGYVLTNPYIYTRANVPTDGWYVASVQCSSSSAAMSVWVYSGTGWVKQVDLPSGVGSNYPALIYLGAGYHYVYFVVKSGVCYVSSVSWHGV